MLGSDILWRLSGGTANADPNLSLGGAQSTTPMATSLPNLFANVTSGERATGSTKYRCVYLVNDHPTQVLSLARVFIPLNTPSSGTVVALGVDPSGVGGTAVTTPDEDTAPAGVVFDHSPPPTDRATGLALGSPSELGPGEAVALWFRRIVNPGTASLAEDPFTVTLHGTPT